MPHYTCANCRVRHRTSGAPGELVENLCPQCGSRLQPAAELQDVVGFQRIGRAEDPAGAAQATSHPRLGDRLDVFTARRSEGLLRDALDAEGWGGDDDPIAIAVALPVAERYS